MGPKQTSHCLSLPQNTIHVCSVFVKQHTTVIFAARYLMFIKKPMIPFLELCHFRKYFFFQLSQLPFMFDLVIQTVMDKLHTLNAKFKCWCHHVYKGVLENQQYHIYYKIFEK